VSFFNRGWPEVFTLLLNYWSNGKRRPRLDDDEGDDAQVRFNKLIDRVEGNGRPTWDEYDPNEVHYESLKDEGGPEGVYDPSPRASAPTHREIEPVHRGPPPREYDPSLRPPPKEYDPSPGRPGFEQQSYRDGVTRYGIRHLEPFPEPKYEVEPLDERFYKSEPTPVVQWEEPQEELERRGPEPIIVEEERSLRDYMGPQEGEQQLILFGGIPVNTVIFGMQLAATFALLLVFVFNHYLNYEFVKQLAAFSSYADHSPVTAAILGAITGFFLVYFPPLEYRFKRLLVLFALGIILLFFFIGPVFVYLISGSWQDFAMSLREVTLGFLKIIAVIVYWFPMIIGIYGIWSKKQWCIGVAAFFLLVIIVAVDAYMEVEGLATDKGSTYIASYLLFGLLLLIFIEIGDTLVRFTEFPMTPYSVDEKGNQTPHLERIIANYFLFFIMFSCLAVVFSIVIFKFDSFIRLVGSDKMANSIEINSVFGIVLSLVILVLVLSIIIALFREEKKIRAGLRRVSEFRLPFSRRREEEEMRREKVSFLVEEYPDGERVVD